MAVEGVDFVDAEKVVVINLNKFDEDLLEYETFCFSWRDSLPPYFFSAAPQHEMTPEEKAAYKRGFNSVR